MTAGVHPTVASTARHPMTAAPSIAAAAAVPSLTSPGGVPTPSHADRLQAAAVACCRRIGVSAAEFTDLDRELRVLLGSTITPIDVFWIAANRCLLDAAPSEDWARVVAIYDEMADVLRSEGRRTDALNQQCRIAAQYLTGGPSA